LVVVVKTLVMDISKKNLNEILLPTPMLRYAHAGRVRGGCGEREGRVQRTRRENKGNVQVTLRWWS
jgi:hypothetical protein